MFAFVCRSADLLLGQLEYERWRQAKLDAEISSYQCRLLRLGELLRQDSSVSSLTFNSSSQVIGPIPFSAESAPPFTLNTVVD